LPERTGIVGGRGYKIGVVLFFRCKNLFVVSVSERCKGGTVQSGTGAFPNVFSATNRGSKNVESRSEPRI